MSTGMSTRGAKRQRRIEQEDDNQSNVTFEGIDVVDDFGPIMPSPSGEADPIKADLHSRGSISAIHELEVLHTAIMVCLLPWHSCCLCQPVVHKHPTQQCN
jgi:hypothetical protein